MARARLSHVGEHGSYLGVGGRTRPVGMCGRTTDRARSSMTNASPEPCKGSPHGVGLRGAHECGERVQDRVPRQCMFDDIVVHTG